MENLTFGKELLSIIVPVYNCEKYLEECIDSIIRQTYKNMEIILVDDGSTDSSGEICDQYIHRDARIKVIHKENGGQQDARSAGIAISQGVFIGFVDSDDWIEADMYENLYKSVGQADLITSGLWQYDKNGAAQKIVDALEAGIYDGQSKFFCNNLIVYMGQIESGMLGGIVNSISNKLFKASIVKKIYPQVNVNIKSGEDLLFTIVYALMCKQIIVTHECYYHYRYNSVSMSYRKNLDYLSEMNIFYRVLDKALVGHAFEENLRDQLNRMVMYYVYTYTSSMMQMNMELYYPQYIFPQNHLLYKKRIVLFGSGKVGKSYYLDWKYNASINVVQWIDSSPAMNEIFNCSIQEPGEIVRDGFDYVVCAVLNQQLAEDMKKQLIESEINEDMILWEKPEDIFRKFFLIR